MDRFIAYGVPHNLKAKKCLKSNMDRFIDFVIDVH